jgi:hypothetical protein
MLSAILEHRVHDTLPSHHLETLRHLPPEGSWCRKETASPQQADRLVRATVSSLRAGQYQADLIAKMRRILGEALTQAGLLTVTYRVDGEGALVQVEGRGARLDRIVLRPGGYMVWTRYRKAGEQLNLQECRLIH